MCLQNINYGPLGFALTQPDKFSAKACIQVWSTANTKDVNNFKFTYNNEEYSMNRDVIAKALHLPEGASFHDSYPDVAVSRWIENLGYNGSMERLEGC